MRIDYFCQLALRLAPIYSDSLGHSVQKSEKERKREREKERKREREKERKREREKEAKKQRNGQRNSL